MSISWQTPVITSITTYEHKLTNTSDYLYNNILAYMSTNTSDYLYNNIWAHADEIKWFPL